MTSVSHRGPPCPRLAAKPIIDMLLVIADPADEEAYVAACRPGGDVLRIREPDWHKHRMLKRPAGRAVDAASTRPGVAAGRAALTALRRLHTLS
jgi:hypothetical protein